MSWWGNDDTAEITRQKTEELELRQFLACKLARRQAEALWSLAILERMDRLVREENTRMVEKAAPLGKL
jgi:hypothetical protein